MKTQHQNVTDDLVVVTQRNTRAKTSTNGGEVSGPIPLDLIVDIFLRLPGKSIARCRCVSKQLASILRLPYFTELFLTRSLSRPKLLFACQKNGHVYFFSSPPPQNLDENTSLLAVNYLMKIPFSDSLCERYIRSIRSLIFLGDEQMLEGKKHKVSVICNPSTGQSLTLPKLMTRKRIGVRSYLGYDPIEKQYKVLSMTWLIHGRRYLKTEEHQVLTLGTGERSWRRIECCMPHSLSYHEYNHICINGVLYYRALNTSTGGYLIVFFDFRSEKFRFVKDTDILNASICSPLINYNGKLGSLGSQDYRGIHERCTLLQLRVLEDAEKNEWSKHIYVLPSSWRTIVGGERAKLRVVGMTQSNEIVLSLLRCQSTPFYVFYYNAEKNTIRRVEIQGLEAFKGQIVYTFQDHVEDVNGKLLERSWSSLNL